MNFFKSRNVNNNAINHRIAKQIWANIARLHKGLDEDLPAYMSDSPRGVQLAERHEKNGKSVYIRELDSPHRVLAYPVSHSAIRANTISETRLDWKALAKISDGRRPIVVDADKIKINRALIDFDRAKRQPEYLEMVSRQKEVTDRFGPLFRAPATLTLNDFQAFLLEKYNHHWSTLHRQGPNLLEQGLAHLQKTIAILVDESRPIAEGYDAAVGRQKGMAQGIATAILIVAYPGKYGVWNDKSEAGLIELERWPEPFHGASDGQSYEAINDALLELAETNKVDLWSLDGLLHFIQQPDIGAPSTETTRTELQVASAKSKGSLNPAGLSVVQPHRVSIKSIRSKSFGF